MHRLPSHFHPVHLLLTLFLHFVHFLARKPSPARPLFRLAPQQNEQKMKCAIKRRQMNNRLVNARSVEQPICRSTSSRSDALANLTQQGHSCPSSSNAPNTPATIWLQSAAAWCLKMVIDHLVTYQLASGIPDSASWQCPHLLCIFTIVFHPLHIIQCRNHKAPTRLVTNAFTNLLSLCPEFGCLYISFIIILTATNFFNNHFVIAKWNKNT